MRIYQKARALGYEVKQLRRGLYHIKPIGWFRPGAGPTPTFWAESQREVAELLTAIEEGRSTDRWLT